MLTFAKRNFVLIFLLLTVTALAQSVNPQMVGTWSQEGAPETVWTFKADGSGFIEQANPRTTARFNWSCQGVRLQVSTSGANVPYTVVSNDANSLVLRNDRASTVYTLRRKG